MSISPCSSLKWVYLQFLIVLVFSVDSVLSGSLVRYLPGYRGELPFKLETGYVSVDDSELFYYFIESQNNPARDPIFLWLTGGPGCSAFSGLIYENGPIMFDTENYNGGLPGLLDYPYAWTQNGSFLYVDAPVGTGFSYSRTLQGWPSSDTKSSEQSYQFIRKWLDEHPQYLPVDLFISGDSYSGIIVPLIVKKILDDNEAGVWPRLTIKGYLIGSPRTDSTIETNSKVVFAHRMTLIPDELYESAKTNCKGNYANVDPSNTQCLIDIQAIEECIKDVNTKQILEPKCSWKFPKSNTNYRGRSLEEHRIDQLILQQRKPPKLSPYSCWQDFSFALSYIWANDEKVQDALHIRKGSVLDWKRCNESLSYTKDVLSVVHVHQYLTKKDNLRVLVECGDHDMVVPVEETTTWIKSLNMTIEDEWRPWFVEGQVAGYTRKYSSGYGYRLTFVTVKGAGHTAPEFKRKECYDIFRRWIQYYPL